MSSEYEYELQILAGCFRKEIFEKVSGIISEEYFRNENTNFFYKFICEFHKRYNSVPTRKLFLEELKKTDSKRQKKEILLQILRREKDIKEKEVFYFIDLAKKIKKACFQAELCEKLLISSENGEVEDFEKHIEVYQEKIKIFDVYSTDDVVDMFSEFEARFSEEAIENGANRKFFDIGFKDNEVDFSKILEGTISPEGGTAISVIGASGVGKSTFCLNINKKALFQGFNVLDVSLEGDSDWTKCQYDSLISKIPVKRLFRKEITPKEKNVLKSRYERIKGKLFFEQWNIAEKSFSDIEIRKDQIEQKYSIKLDFISIRPIYHLLTKRNISPEEKRTFKVALYEESKAFSQKHGVVIFLEDQARTEKWGQRYYDKNDTMDARNVSKELDLMLGLPQTPKEEKLDRIRLQLLKSRFSENKRFEVKLSRDFRRARFLNGAY